MAQKLSVRVLNPAPNGSEFSTHKRASLFVASGYAVWDGRHIRMIHTPIEPRKPTDSTGLGYDRISRCMSLDEIAGLPCARPERALWGKDVRRL